MDKEKREPEKPKNKAKAVHGKSHIPAALRKTTVQNLLILAGFSLVVSLLLTPSFIMETPFYQLGDIANQNIKAKRDFLIEDREATSKKREEAVRQAAGGLRSGRFRCTAYTRKTGGSLSGDAARGL